MVRRFPISGSSWFVQIGPASDEASARLKALAYIRRHPGLEWTGGWTEISPCEMAVIEVASKGAVVVSIGVTASHRDAKNKTELLIKRLPYLKWMGNSSKSGWSANFQIAVEAYLPVEWHMLEGSVGSCLPVGIGLRIKNRTPHTVVRIDVRDSNDGDWGVRKPSTELPGSEISSGGFLLKELDVNFWHLEARFTLRLTLRSGQWLQCEVNGRAAIDNSMSLDAETRLASGPGLTALTLAHPDSRMLEVIALHS